MPEKVKLAIFDNDNRIRSIKKYDVSENGTQIRVISGGEGHFMPKFDTECGLDFQGRKRFFLFGTRQWDRLYFVKNKGAKCVNFKTGEVSGPSPEESKKAIGQTLLGQIGQEGAKVPIIVYVLLALNTLFLLMIMKASGVF